MCFFMFKSCIIQSLHLNLKAGCFEHTYVELPLPFGHHLASCRAFVVPKLGTLFGTPFVLTLSVALVSGLPGSALTLGCLEVPGVGIWGVEGRGCTSLVGPLAGQGIISTDCLRRR